MSFNVLTIASFDRQLKRLAKKYPSLKSEFSALLDTLENDPEQGVPIGKNCFKIRIAIASKGKGKRGGARLITNIVVTNSTVYLLSIYDKSEKENLSSKELDQLLELIEV